MGGWCYMLRCADDSFYVGATSQQEIVGRVLDHNEGKFGGYTSTRRPVELVWADWFNDLRDAQDSERQIKGWRRAKKEALVAQDWKRLQALSKRPSSRRPSRAATRPPQGDASSLAAQPPDSDASSLAARPSDSDASSLTRHPEVRAKRASKDESAGNARE